MRQYKRRKGKSLSKAKKHIFEGVNYKSGLEMKMAMELSNAKIPFKYEPIKFILSEGFFLENEAYERQSNGKGQFKQRGEKKILPISYTPDFVGDKWIIETKGYANESFPIKWKLMKKLINGKNITLYKPQCHKECEEVIRIIKSKENG